MFVILSSLKHFFTQSSTFQCSKVLEDQSREKRSLINTIGMGNGYVTDKGTSWGARLRASDLNGAAIFGKSMF